MAISQGDAACTTGLSASIYSAMLAASGSGFSSPLSSAQQDALKALCYSVAQGAASAHNADAPAGGVTDHGLLTGLTDDDHPQYLLRTDYADSTYEKTYSLTFPLGSVSTYVALGTITTTSSNSGNFEVFVGLDASGTSVAKTYRFSTVGAGGGGSSYKKVMPLSTAGVGTNDFELTLTYATGAAGNLRIQRTLGSTAVTVAVTIRYQGPDATPFTPATVFTQFGAGTPADYHPVHNFVSRLGDSMAGPLQFTGTGASRPAASATERGKLWFTQGAAGVADSIAVCMKDAAGAYAWVNL